MMEIHNAVTDALLGAFAAALGVRILRARGSVLPQRLWAYALIGNALAAFGGATWHALRASIGPRASFWVWKVTVYAIGVFGLAAVAGSIIAMTAGRLRKTLLIVMGSIAAGYFVHMATHREFIYVIGFNAAAMLLLLVVHVRARREAASPWMIGGVVVSAVAAGIQASRVTLHAQFDNNDLFHVVQMGGSYLFYRGARLLGDGPSEAR